ncbi:MAG: hypothetical protein QXO30_02275 [Candidatus Caldarchaeum sp.]
MRSSVSAEFLLVLGGSVFAVAKAVRLAREGYRVMLVCPRRRLGLFPFALLPEFFISELGVEPRRHSEAEITACTFGGQLFKTPTLHVTRATPLLEEAVAYNEITFSHKQPTAHSDETIDCNPVEWEGLKLYQHVSVDEKKASGFVKVEARPNSAVSITVSWGRTSLSYLYSFKPPSSSKPLTAHVQRDVAYRLQPGGEPFPVVSLLGQDHAESLREPAIRVNGETVLKVLNDAEPRPSSQLVQSLLTGLR